MVNKVPYENNRLVATVHNTSPEIHEILSEPELVNNNTSPCKNVFHACAIDYHLNVRTSYAQTEAFEPKFVNNAFIIRCFNVYCWLYIVSMNV